MVCILEVFYCLTVPDSKIIFLFCCLYESAIRMSGIVNILYHTTLRQLLQVLSQPHTQLLHISPERDLQACIVLYSPFLPLKESHRFVVYPLYIVFSPVIEVAKLPEAVFTYFPAVGIEPGSLTHEARLLVMS